ncbi:hypothetical protein ACKAV7_014645 [Fusarium commune]
MSIKDHNLTLLNSREDWTNWINSIEDLAVRNDVWSYCDPEGIENLVFTATKPSDSASKDTIQKYHSLQAIYDSERKKYDKVSDRIDLTVCQEFKQHYLGIHDVRGKLIALADSIQPTAKDQKQNVRTEFEKLKKGLSNTSLDKWLSRWPALVNNAKRYKIENLSESQICDAFITIIISRTQVESEKNLVKEAAKTMEKISNAFLTALNEINPDHASSGSVTVASLTDSEEEENGEDDDVTIVQKAQNTVNRALKTFRKLNPTLSEKKIIIGFCIKQFRTMVSPKEKAIRGRAAHATLQGRKHNNDSDLQNEGDQPQQKRQRTRHSSSNMGFRNCVCGMSHKYTECYYLNPSGAPEGWTPIVQIQSKIITIVKGSKRLKENIERNLLNVGGFTLNFRIKNLKRSNIDLPKFWPSDTTKNQPKHLAEDETSSTDKFLSKSRAAFVTSRCAFGTTARDEYGDCFRLDNCADTHVCNDLSRFTNYTPLDDETIEFGNSGTHITGIGNVTVHADTPTSADLNSSIKSSISTQQQSLETLLGISSQRKSLKQQLDAASIKAESGRTTLADLPTVQIGCKRYIPEEYIANKNRKGRRSWIQAYGFFLTEVSPDLQTLQTYWACSKCDECGKSSLFVATNTTSPIEHLRRSHMITEADGNAYEDSSRADSQPPSKRRCLELPTARSNVNKAKELTVGWIVTANLPFTAPSNPYLRRMLDLHDASLAKEVPWSRQSSQRLALALTCGLLQTGTLFLGLHAHYLDASYQVQSRLLALRRVWGAHSGDNQATTIYDIFGEYGIRDRIGAGVCDNVSSNDTCLASLYRQLSPAMAEEDIRNNRTRCFGHIVNLAARAFLWGEDPDSFEREAFTEAAFQVEERELRLWRKRGAVGKLHNIVRLLGQSPLYPAAVILHPRWNVSWLEANWTSHEQLVWLRDAKNSVREFFEQQYPRKEQSEAARTMIGKAMRQDEPSQFDQWMQSYDRYMMEEEDELGVYMRQGPVRRENLNPILWWKEHQEEYPRLSKFALDILAIPAMSVDPERTFSVTKLTISSQRHSLSPEIIEEIQCLRNWLGHQAITVGEVVSFGGDLMGWDGGEA